MSVARWAGAIALACALTVTAVPVDAESLVPFSGNWAGSTVAAVPIDDKTVLVTAAGTGVASHLGAFFMSSPHLTYLDTFAVEGTQEFVAANGDKLNATISGQLLPNAEGNLEAKLAGIVTGGTGRFSGTTGHYTFHIIAVPVDFGFNSTATFYGAISIGGFE